MRALFFGTPDIAVPALDALHAIAEIAAVVCQPDRPSGRGLKLKACPVKERAQQLGLDVHQPKKVRTKAFAEWIRSLEVDVALVIAYGRILPKAVLEGPRLGCVNLHASILPFHRGAAPINWAIVRGDRETGVSLMQMDEGCDTGPVFEIRRIPIGPDETAGQLYERLGALAASMTTECLPNVISGSIVATPQAHDRSTHAPMLSRADGAIDWRQSAAEIHDRVRGLTPWPGAHASLDGGRVKIHQTAIAGEAEGNGKTIDGNEDKPGTIRKIGKATIGVACGDGMLLIRRAQLPGKRALDARDLLSGRALADGQRFALENE